MAKRRPSENTPSETRFASQAAAQPQAQTRSQAEVAPISSHPLFAENAPPAPELSGLSLFAWPLELWALSLRFWRELLPLYAGMVGLDRDQNAPEIRRLETETEYLFEIRLPGARREDISLSVHGHTLVLETTLPQRLSRALSLPIYANGQAIRATLHEGTLTIAIPKSNKPLPPRLGPVSIT